VHSGVHSERRNMIYGSAFRMLLAGSALIQASEAFTVGGVRAPNTVVRSNTQILMDENVVSAVKSNPWNDPREGEPFGNADRAADGSSVLAGGGTIRYAEPSPQPRALSDATIPKPSFIETDDEPWNAECKSTVTLTKSMATQGFSEMLPFMQAEEDLEEAFNTAADAGAVKAAISAALAAGARAGSPAVVNAEKMAKAFETDAEAAKKSQKKKKVAAQGNGWDMAKREVAKVHDNSVA